MFRLIWKQQWKQFLYGFVVVAAYAGCVVYAAISTHHQPFANQTILNLTRTGFAIPVILGMFWGAPLLSSEYESGTHKFIWTQGISRTKWLTAKLGYTMFIAGLCGLVCSLFASWWFNMQLSESIVANPFGPAQFGLTGAMPVVYAMFAVALGAATGAWIRKPVASIGTVLVVYAIIQFLFIGHIRPYYMAATTYMYKPSRGCVTTNKANDSTITCAYTDFGPASLRYGNPWILSFSDNDGATYQPGNRYRDFQAIETALYVGLIAVTVLATYRLVLKQDV